jgi:hypothetical protein
MLKLLIATICCLALAVFAQTPEFDLSKFVPYTPPPKKIWPLEDSYAKCLLDDLPGVASDVAAYQIARQCIKKYPEAFGTDEIVGPFAFSNPGECIAKKARDTVTARECNVPR